jgi:hypothetical protein
MTRWLILIVTTLIWAWMMAWVYSEHSGSSTSMDVQSDRMALEALFDERASAREVWRVYFDPQLMRPPAERSKPFDPADGFEETRKTAFADAVWAGAREGEVFVGTREVKQTIRGFTRAEVSTHMQLQWPAGFGDAPFQFSGNLIEDGTMRFSRERGLEDISARARVIAALELRTRGYREGDSLKLTLTFFNGPDKKIMDQEMLIPLIGSCAPTFGLSPFFFNPQIHPEDRWTVATLNLAPQERGRLRTLTVRVTKEQKTIQYMGLPTPVYEAVAKGESSTSTAYYSPDGHVLLQFVQFAGLRLTMIREELRETQP